MATDTGQLRCQLGGVFGVPVVAAVLTANGRYASTATFLDGFTPALWVAVSLSLVDLVTAVLSPAKVATAGPTTSVPEAAGTLNSST